MKNKSKLVSVRCYSYGLISMPRGTKVFLVFLGLLLLDIGFIFFFMLDAMPFFYPLMIQGDYWLLWLVIGSVVFPLTLLITYVWMKTINYEYDKWKQAVLLAIPFFICVISFGYIFDMILPFELEPFRSIVLPAMVFTIVFLIVARFKHPQNTDSSQ